MRARKSVPLIWARFADVWLQRGRACEGAEIRRVFGSCKSEELRFNGAAPVRARKWSSLQLSQNEGTSFNGAAPGRARK